MNGADTGKAVVATRYGYGQSSDSDVTEAGIEMIAIPDRDHLLKNAL